MATGWIRSLDEMNDFIWVAMPAQHHTKHIMLVYRALNIRAKLLKSKLQQ